MEENIAQQHQILMQSIMKHKLDLEPNDFTFHEILSGNNNHIYCIDASAFREKAQVAQSYDVSTPLTSPIASDVDKLILRISKSNVSLTDSVRVRNEVVFLNLGSQALAQFGEIVPRVYDWSDEGPSESHWILEEWKHGRSLSKEEFHALEIQTKQAILIQIAQIVKRFQDFQLPEHFVYGGITCDDEGAMSSAEPTIPCGGPFPSYAALLKGMCKWQLSAAERNQHIDGWKDKPSLRNRINAFFGEGLDDMLDAVSENRKALIHGDLCLANMLFDPATYRITAILDFDFAHIAHPVSEFLFSFLDFSGLLTSNIEPEGRLHDLQIQGFPDDVSDLDEALQLARSWDRVLRDVGAQRPSTIPHAETIANIWWFSQELCQPFWFIDRWVTNQTEEKLVEVREDCATKLDRYLTMWGF